MFKNNKIYNLELITEAENLTFKIKDSFFVMQKAAKACSKYIVSNYKPQKVLILCGPGNNGGDGILIAQNLIKKKFKVSIITPIGCAKSNDSKKAFNKLTNKKIVKKSVNFKDYDLLVDALFGFNFNKKLSKKLNKIIKNINSKKFTKIAIDVPSGVYCDNGQIDQVAIQADITLTFHRLKPCHVLQPGKDLSNKVKILDIGLTNIDSKSNINLIEKPKIKHLPSKFHKYNRGELFIIASSEMIGASKLATLAASQIAFKSGVGIVKLLVKKENKNFYKPHILEELIVSYSGIKELEKIIKEKENSTFLFGCGLEINNENSLILKILLTNKTKLVVDASSFTIIQKDLKKYIPLFKSRKSDTILTPHYGEFKKIFKISKNKIIDTRKASYETNSVVLFKGNDTVISNTSGIIYINYFSSVYLATAGSGDVLSGIIASLLAQNYEPLEAAKIGCFLHSQSAIKINKPLSAKDIIDKLPYIIKQYSNI